MSSPLDRGITASSYVHTHTVYLPQGENPRHLIQRGPLTELVCCVSW